MTGPALNTPREQESNVELRSQPDVFPAQLFAGLPGGEGESVTLRFISISVSVPQGQSALAYVQAPAGGNIEPPLKQLWIPLQKQGTFHTLDTYVGTCAVDFSYIWPNGASTAPIPPCNVSVVLNEDSASKATANAYFSWEVDQRSVVHQLAPASAFPARHVQLATTTFDGNSLGLSAAAIVDWKKKIGAVLAQSTAAFSPKVFLVDPFQTGSVSLVLQSSLQISLTETFGWYSITAEVDLILWQNNGEAEESLFSSTGKTTLNTTNFSPDPNALFELLAPTIAAAANAALSQLIQPPFNAVVPWRVPVEAVTATAIQIRASQMDNLQPGDLLDLARPTAIQGGTIYSYITTLRVVNVPASPSLLTDCAYYTTDQPPVQVGDVVGVCSSATIKR